MTSTKSNVLEIRQLNSFYGNKQVLKDIDLTIQEKSVTSLMGPSGCGKSTLIRCLNRMNDLVGNFRLDGKILYRGTDLYSKDIDVTDLRREIGMVFQKPNPFHKSSYVAHVVHRYFVHQWTYFFDDQFADSLFVAGRARYFAYLF